MNHAARIDLLFHSAIARFFAIPARQPASGSVTFAQMRVLWVLEQKAADSLVGVSRVLGISKPAATELVDRLVRGDYVRRDRSSSDRRQAILTLRPRGIAMMRDFARRRQERFQKLLRVIGRADAGRLEEALQELNRILQVWSGATS